MSIITRPANDHLISTARHPPFFLTFRISTICLILVENCIQVFQHRLLLDRRPTGLGGVGYVYGTYEPSL